MSPSRDEIQKAAYHRWERRGRAHGHDLDDWIAAAMDLTYTSHYKTILELPFAGEAVRVVVGHSRARCRFCELSPPRAALRTARPIFPECVGPGSIRTRELCDECAEQFAGTIDLEFERFWQSLESLRTAESNPREVAPSYVPMG